MPTLTPLPSGTGTNTALQPVKVQTPNGDSAMNDTADSVRVTVYDTTGAAAAFGDTSILPKGSSSQTIFSYTGLYNAASNTIHTVTGGKTFYLSQILVSVDLVGTGDFYVKDNATSKIQMKYGSALAGEHFNIVFPAPIAFSTSVIFTFNSLNAYMTFIGWEQ